MNVISVEQDIKPQISLDQDRAKQSEMKRSRPRSLYSWQQITCSIAMSFTFCRAHPLQLPSGNRHRSVPIVLQGALQSTLKSDIWSKDGKNICIREWMVDLPLWQSEMEKKALIIASKIISDCITT
jgi:hypothetical protein